MPVWIVLFLAFCLSCQQLAAEEVWEALLKDAELYRSRGDYDKAFAICDDVIRYSAQNGDSAGIAAALNTRGGILRSQDKYDEATDVLEHSLAIAKLVGDQSLVASSLQSIALVYQDRGEHEFSLPFLEESLAILKDTNDCAGKARGLSMLGHVFDYQGQYEKAIDSYTRSLRLREEIGDKVRIAGAYTNLATVLGTVGNPRAEFENYKKAEKIFEEAGERGNLAIVLNNLGNLYSSYGNYRMALQSHLKSLQIREELGRVSDVIYSQINIGVIHELQGNYSLALEFYQKALLSSREIGDKFLESFAVHNIGGIHALEGRYKEALIYFEKGLQLREKQLAQAADSLYAIGAVYELMGDYKTAQRYFTESIEKNEIYKNKVRIPEACLGLSRIFLEWRDFTQAEDYAERALSVAREMDNHELIWGSLTQQAKIFMALRRPQEAEKALTQAIAGVESLRTQVAGGEMEGQQFFSTRQDPYYTMIDLLTTQNRNLEALQFAERVKARILLDVLRTGRVEIIKSMTPQQKGEEQQLVEKLALLNSKLRGHKHTEEASRAMIHELEEQVKTARLNLESFRTNLYSEYPALKTQRAELQTIDLEKAAALTGDSGAILEYVVAKDKMFLFVITGGQTPELKVITVPLKQKDLAAVAESYRERLGKRDLESFSLGRKLYSLVLKPAEKEIAGKKQIVIIPDQELWELPFQAMQSSTGEFLLERYSISYASSLSVLHEMTKLRHQTRNQPTLLAFGNPSLSDKSRIPQTEVEVESLAALYGNNNSRIFTKRNAREAALKSEAPKHEIIHIASHGILSNASPMYSQVILADEEVGQPEDGLLEPWEVLNMDLDSSMVVLSACETGRGKIGAGEGIIGFTWALFVAGCPSTVVSQWQVDSESTTALMVEFHRNLIREKMDKAQALRQAALKLLRDPRYSNPYYWAGFVVVGDSSPL